MKLAILTVIAFFLILPGVVLATPLSAKAAATDVFKDVCTQTPDANVCKENQQTQTPDNNSIYGPNGIFTAATKLVSIIVGVAAVFMIIIGAMMYILSTGDPTRVNNAKNMILYAIIGLIVVVVAQALIVFVIRRL